MPSASLEEIMPASHYIFCIYYINNNVLGRVIKFFLTTKQVKS